ncbi:hypothetical protein Pmani_038521 [Petrolisthes manimaculis]|uniref:Uncharacterized protein n=1 Tax=Petrolisthes manimaculis TaxID=1843537 RepID=A0AAE1NGR7_9EUCA|nr:hypothetical protein Pmani_038521 [Petrolisthes manimaculis]
MIQLLLVVIIWTAEGTSSSSSSSSSRMGETVAAKTGRAPHEVVVKSSKVHDKLQKESQQKKLPLLQEVPQTLPLLLQERTLQEPLQQQQQQQLQNDPQQTQPLLKEKPQQQQQPLLLQNEEEESVELEPRLIWFTNTSSLSLGSTGSEGLSLEPETVLVIGVLLAALLAATIVLAILLGIEGNKEDTHYEHSAS